MMEKLWGDNFFDPSTKKWTKKNTGSATCKRGFVQFVYEPIKGIIEAAMNDNKTKLFGMCDKLGISGKLKSDDREKIGKPLMKAIMQAWLPASQVSLQGCSTVAGTGASPKLPCAQMPALCHWMHHALWPACQLSPPGSGTPVEGLPPS